MTAKGTLRGHIIYWDGEQYRYEDTDTPTVSGHKERACGRCRLPNREDGHDACLGELPGVMNACCGHGKTTEAYIQYPDGSAIRGLKAATEMSKLTSGKLWGDEPLPVRPEKTDKEKEQDACEDCLPAFNLEEVKQTNMSSGDIRKKYPRFNGTCQTCGYYGIKYACYEQYIYGDY